MTAPSESKAGQLVGRTLGPYRIQALIGAGGMGEVYRAHDPRLGRDVAVKVVAQRLGVDPDAIQRFEREARAVAALSHPNILAIHDFGTDAGITYAVSELLEGETLAQRIARGPLAWRSGVAIAIQIAEGLTAAHARGIVHRDLKPANVFLTSSGTTKILDFGVARVIATTSAVTLSALTEPGALIGTVGYMSPEQVRGEEVGPASDIFAFGCILHEMLSGAAPFTRATAPETTAAILRDDPIPLLERVRDIPPALDAIAAHCLQKRPEDRFHSAADMAFALRAAAMVSLSNVQRIGGVSGAAPHTYSWWRNGRGWAWATLAAIAIGAAAIGAALILRPRTDLPNDYVPLTFRRGSVTNARFGADGGTVVFSALWEGDPPRVFVKRPESPDALPTGTADTELMALSASGELAVSMRNSQVAAFGWKGTLARMPMVGGAPRELIESVITADWFPDGQSLAVVRDLGDRQRVDCGPGKQVYETRGYLTDLRVAPRGDWIAFLEHPIREAGSGHVVAFSPSTGERRDLAAGTGLGRDHLGLAWRPDGGEIWFGEYGGLRAVTLDGKERTVAHLPESVRLHDIAPDGRVLLSHESRRVQIGLMTMDDPRVRDLSWLTWSLAIAFTPDGRALLFDEFPQKPGAAAIAALRPLDGSPVVRLGEGYATAISPDGKWAAAVGGRSRSQIQLMPTGPGEPRLLPQGRVEAHAMTVFLPDGQEVVFIAREAGHGMRLYRQRIAGGDPAPISPEGVGLTLLRVSPDGSQIVANLQDGRPAVLSLAGGELRAVPGAAPGDIAAGWTGDGRSVYLRGLSPQIALRRVDLRDGSSETVCLVRVPDLAGVRWIGPLAIAPDGRTIAFSYFRMLSTLYLVTGLK